MMFSVEFPDPQLYDFPQWAWAGDFFYSGRDIISVGNELTFANVREAYAKGIFPWYMKGGPLPWYCPRRRAVLEFSNIHISRSLAKARRASRFSFTINGDFNEVIRNCAAVPRGGQAETWITPEFIEVYTELHSKGYAHSVEVLSEDGILVGGLYGVDAGGVFCGESMFHLRPNASKFALLFLIEYLQERGADWIDIQVMTPHMKALGAHEIPRKEFLSKLRNTQAKNLRIF